MSTHPAPLPAPLYQGSVSTWECDEGGHLNVRFHLERAMAGLAHFAHHLALPRANTQAAGSTLAPLEAHIRFLKEARPGAPLAMHGGVLALDETEARLCLDMRHADGAPSACFTLRVAHVDTRQFAPFPWSARTREAAEALMIEAPAHGTPRSIDITRAPSEATRAAVITAGAARIGGALVSPDQCDAFGRLRAEHFIGRVSDSVPNLLARWRGEAKTSEGGAAAGAVVEARLVFRRWPRAGDLIEVFSGLSEVGEKTQRLTHWLIDPASGKAWASMEAVTLTFDTATRKTVAPSAEVRAAMQARVISLRV